MALPVVPANAITAPITIPAGARIAVVSLGAFKVDQVGLFTNYPTTNQLGIPVTDNPAGGTQFVSAAFASGATVIIDAYGGQDCWYSVGTDPVVNLGGRVATVPNNVLPASFAAINASATATVAQLLTLGITSTTAGAVVVTAPTAALIDAATTLAVGDSFDVLLINTGGTNALSISGGTGNTYLGAISTTAGGMTARFTKTAAGAFTIYRV